MCIKSGRKNCLQITFMQTLVRKDDDKQDSDSGQFFSTPSPFNTKIVLTLGVRFLMLLRSSHTPSTTYPNILCSWAVCFQPRLVIFFTTSTIALEVGRGVVFLPSGTTRCLLVVSKANNVYFASSGGHDNRVFPLLWSKHSDKGVFEN